MAMLKALNSQKDDVILSWASAAYFIGSAINGCVKNVFSIPAQFWGVISALTGIVILAFLFKGYKCIGYRSKLLFWRSYALFLFIYFFSAILILFHGDPLDQMISGTALLTFVWWIPTGVMACSVKDKSVLYHVWVKASYIISFFALLLYFFHIPDENIVGAGNTEYNIFFGYTMILPLLIQMTEFQRTKRLILLPLILLELFTVIAFSSRGILLSVVFFFLYKFGFESKNPLKRVISISLMVAAVVVLMSNIGTMVENAMRFMDVFGAQSRSLEAIANGTMAETSGRDSIWEVCFRMIRERPVFGWGLGGEYYEIAKAVYGTSQGVTAEAYHPHNGLIQNFVCFGIFGGLIASIIVLLPIFGLNKTKNTYTHDLLVVFVAATIVPMCVSSAHFFTRSGVAICLYLFYFENYWALKKKSYGNTNNAIVE